jgi:hypothetical protein
MVPTYIKTTETNRAVLKQTGIETTETDRAVLKQTETNQNNPKYALFQTVWVGPLFVSVQSKHRNSLFRYRSETTKTNCFEVNQKQKKSKKNVKTLNFLKKVPKHASYQTVSVGLLFVSVQLKHRNSLFQY